MLLSMSYLHMKDIYVIHLGRQMRLLFILTQSGGRWTALVDFSPSLRVTQGLTSSVSRGSIAPPLVISHVLPLLMFSVLQFSNSHWSEKSPFQMYLYVLVIICNIDEFY